MTAYEKAKYKAVRMCHKATCMFERELRSWLKLRGVVSVLGRVVSVPQSEHMLTSWYNWSEGVIDQLQFRDINLQIHVKRSI